MTASSARSFFGPEQVAALRHSKAAVFWRKYGQLILTVLLFLFLLFSWMENVILAGEDSGHYVAAFALFFKFGRYLIYLMLAIAVVLNLISRRTYNLYLFLAIGVLSVIVLIASRNMPFAILTLYLFAFTPLGFKRGVKVYVLALSMVLIGVLFLSALGVFPNINIDPARNRYGLGFTWVSTAPVLFFFLLMSLMGTQAKKLSSITLWSFVLIDICLFLLTDTNFTFLAILILLLVFALYRNRPDLFAFTHKKWFAVALMLLPIVLTLIALLCSFFYSADNTVLNSLNGIFSGRFANAKAAMDEYGFSLFGKPIVWMGNYAGSVGENNYMYVDCSYLNFLLNYGILYWALVMGGCALMVHQASKSHNTLMLILLFFLFCFSFYEVRLLNPIYNPFLLIASHELALPEGWFTQGILHRPVRKEKTDNRTDHKADGKPSRFAGFMNSLHTPKADKKAAAPAAETAPELAAATIVESVEPDETDQAFDLTSAKAAAREIAEEESQAVSALKKEEERTSLEEAAAFLSEPAVSTETVLEDLSALSAPAGKTNPAAGVDHDGSARHNEESPLASQWNPDEKDIRNSNSVNTETDQGKPEGDSGRED